MLNLSETTIQYIDYTYQEELKRVIYTSFNLLEAFGLKFYEDKYTNLISREDTIDNDTKRDTFLLLLKKDIIKIIGEHYIFLSEGVEVTLTELNEITHFLYIIQNLEDYTEVSYRLFGEGTNRHILVELISSLTILSKVRLLEIIEHVEETLIKSLKMFISDKEELKPQEVIEKERIEYVNHFFNFIDKHDCLGLRLYSSGYTNLTLRELIDLIPFDVQKHIDNLSLTNAGQAALDILSVLIITKDNYNLPMLKFNQNSGIFTTKLENVTKYSNVILHMLNDFTQHLEAEKAKDAANDNQA